MALKHFEHASGSKALKSTGEVTGSLLGKDVSGLEAVAAMGNLALGKIDSFMAKAVEAAKVVIKHLDAKNTIPYASPDADFNATLKSAFSAGKKKGPIAARAAPKRAVPKPAPA